MGNKELLRLLLIDKIKKEVKESSFNYRAFWLNFNIQNTNNIEHFGKTYKKVLEDLASQKFKVLKELYVAYLKYLDIDKRTALSDDNLDE